MSAPLGTYDPSRVIIAVGSVIVTGFGPDGFIKVARNEDGVMLQMGAGGDGAITINQNKSGTIDLTLMQTSPSNLLLSAILRLMEGAGKGVVPFQVKDVLDKGTLCSAQSCWVKKWPDMERAKELGVVTWPLESNQIEFFIGGVPV